MLHGNSGIQQSINELHRPNKYFYFVKNGIQYYYEEIQ